MCICRILGNQTTCHYNPRKEKGRWVCQERPPFLQSSWTPLGIPQSTLCKPASGSVNWYLPSAVHPISSVQLGSEYPMQMNLLAQLLRSPLQAVQDQQLLQPWLSRVGCWVQLLEPAPACWPLAASTWACCQWMDAHSTGLPTRGEQTGPVLQSSLGRAKKASHWNPSLPMTYTPGKG